MIWTAFPKRRFSWMDFESTPPALRVVRNGGDTSTRMSANASGSKMIRHLLGDSKEIVILISPEGALALRRAAEGDSFTLTLEDDLILLTEMLPQMSQ